MGAKPQAASRARSAAADATVCLFTGEVRRVMSGFVLALTGMAPRTPPYQWHPASHTHGQSTMSVGFRGVVGDRMSGMVFSLLFRIFVVLVAVAAPVEASLQPVDERKIQPDELTNGAVELAIGALVEGLYSLRGEGGHWDRLYAGSDMENLNRHVNGQSVLAVFALLSAGESYQNPRLLPAVDYIRTRPPDYTDYTYIRSLRCHVWALLPKRFDRALEEDCRWLIRAYDFDAGSWNYTAMKMGAVYDNSLTQYGALGLWESAKRGVDVPLRLWERIEDHFLRTQLLDGGWAYRPQFSQARGSMTAAGLACLYITQDYLARGDGGSAKSKADREKAEEAIERGLRWFDTNFSVAHHPGVGAAEGQVFYYYYLYGIERVGLAGGIKYFGEHDWFREGAAAVLSRLCEPVRDEGGRLIGFQLKEQFPSTGFNEVPVVQLSFALMFLSHGRVPIVVSKVRDDRLSWNTRSRDAANLAWWVGQETEQRLSWQVLDVDQSIEDWFEGALVYLATDQSLPYVKEFDQARNPAFLKGSTDTDEVGGTTTYERIKRYLDLGGLLFTNADSHNDHMTESVEQMARRMYPGAMWRRLPKDHWVYRLSAEMDRPPVLYGLSNGVRELIIHCPRADVGKALQSHDAVNQSDAFTVAANVVYYASERGMFRPRLSKKVIAGERPVSLDELREIAGSGGSVQERLILRGVYGGRWNPEVAADEVWAMRFAAECGKVLRFVDVPLGELGSYAGADSAFLWVRGVEAHVFSESERAGLLAYVDRGGVVLFETVGGVGDFARSAEQAMASLYPGCRFRRMDRHSVVTGDGIDGGTDCSQMSYRLFSYEHLGGRQVRPRLRGLSGDERVRVFSSREDLTHGLLDQPCWGISGYASDDAFELVGNLLGYGVGGVIGCLVVC